MTNYKELIKCAYMDTKEKYYEYVDKTLERNKKLFIITANPETFHMSQTDEIIKDMLSDKNNSIVPDGIAVVKAGHMLGIDFKERIAGVDIAEHLLEVSSKKHYKVYIFGSKQEVLDNMKSVIDKKYSGIDLVGLTNGYVQNKDEVMSEIAKKEPDVVLVALGIPNQEKLIYNHLKEFKKGILIGVGGSIDVLSESKKRAPKIFIKTNTEWLYRIVCEPKRLKRFWDNNIKFMIDVKKESEKR